MSVNVRAEITVYEDDKSEKWGDSPLWIVVESHWNNPGAVVIEIGGGRYTVMAKDMRNALDAATAVR